MECDGTGSEEVKKLPLFPFFWGNFLNSLKMISRSRENWRGTQKLISSFKKIKSDYNIWDMRAWKEYKNKQEVREWVRNGCEPNNCGHVAYCIEKLLRMKVPEEVIIEAIMANPHKTFSRRIVPCFFDPTECPRYRKFGNYSDCNCSEYCGTRG